MDLNQLAIGKKKFNIYFAVLHQDLRIGIDDLSAIAPSVLCGAVYTGCSVLSSRLVKILIELRST